MLSFELHTLSCCGSVTLAAYTLALKRERARRQKIDAAILAAYQVIRQHISLRFISLWPLKRSTRARERVHMKNVGMCGQIRISHSKSFSPGATLYSLRRVCERGDYDIKLFRVGARWCMLRAKSYYRKCISARK